MSTILLRRIIFTIRPAQKCLAGSFFPTQNLSWNYFLKMSSPLYSLNEMFKYHISPNFYSIIFSVLLNSYYCYYYTYFCAIILHPHCCWFLPISLTFSISLIFQNCQKMERENDCCLNCLCWTVFYILKCYKLDGLTFHLPCQRFFPINSGNSGKDGE